jgi:hypothetical protein
MKHPMDKKLQKQLESLSICSTCKTAMNFIDFPFDKLPTNIRSLLKRFKLRYQVVNCPGCGSNGIHTY